jgi:signal transduction histidine kinase
VPVEMLATRFIVLLRASLIGCLLLGASFVAVSANVFVPHHDGRQELAPFLTFLGEEAGAPTAQQVASYAEGRFRPLGPFDRLRPGQDAVYWLRLSVDLGAHAHRDFYIGLDPYPVGRVDVFRLSHGAAEAVGSVNASGRIAERDVRVRPLLVKVQGQGTGPSVYLVRIESGGHPLNTAIYWVSADRLVEQMASTHWTHGLLLGSLFALVVWNAFLWFATRDATYGLYVYYLGSFSALLTVLAGMTPAAFPGEWKVPAIALLTGAALHGGASFVLRFADLRTFAPRLAVALRAIQFATGGIAVLAVLGAWRFGYYAETLLVGPTVALVLCAAFVRWRQGFEPAKFGVIGMSAHATVSLILLSQFSGLTSAHPSAIFWMEAAAAFEALCFSFALAYKIRLAEDEARRLNEEKARLLEAKAEALEQADRANSQRAQFLSMTSHELRSPLQSLLSTVDLLELRLQSSAPQEVRRLRSAGEAMDRFLRDLLTLAKGEAGKLEVLPEPFDVGYLIQDIEDEWRPIAEAKGLEFVATMAPSSELYVADHSRIAQVITNLVSNAVKYTDRGRVTLAFNGFDPATSQLRFEVSDTGRGIPADFLPDLFTPFTRRPGKGRTDGVGIGLAIVRTLCERLAGSVQVSSSEGQGSVFSFAVAAVAMHEAEPAQWLGKSILIVDDNPDILDSLALVAAELGCSPTKAHSPAAAANHLAAERFDVVLIDLDMPVKTGQELAHEIRRSGGPNAASTLVAVSASHEVHDVGSQWPFDAYLAKPVGVRGLRQLLQTFPSAAGEPARPGPR